MKLASWIEHRSQRPIQTGDGFIVANKDDTVIVIVARKGEPVFGLLDDLIARTAESEPGK